MLCVPSASDLFRVIVLSLFVMTEQETKPGIKYEHGIEILTKNFELFRGDFWVAPKAQRNEDF